MFPSITWPALAWPQRSAAMAAVMGAQDVSESFLGAHLPYFTLLSDDVIVTRDGDLMASVLVGGVNSFVADDTDCDLRLHAVAALASQLGEPFAWYVHKITIPHHVSLAPVRGDGFAAEVERRWRRNIDGLHLVQRALLVTLCLRPSLGQRVSALAKRTARQVAADAARRLALLNEAIGFLSASCGGDRVQRLTASDGRWLGLLATILGRPYGLIKPGQALFLASGITDFNVKFDANRFVVDDGAKIRFGAMFSVKSYPPETWSTMLDALSLPYDLCTTNSFTPLRANRIEERIKRTARQMRASEDAAISLQHQLIEAADAVASGRQSFGDHHMTIRLMADSLEELEGGVSEIKRVGQEVGAVFVRESFAARAAYFAQCPTNYAYRGRKAAISAHNFAAFAALHASSPGLDSAATPWGTPLTVFPAMGSTAFQFSFHESGRQDEEPSAGHALFLGVPGSGKTLLAAFLAAQAQRAGARLLVFDKDRGLEMAVRALGGAYTSVRLGEPTGFNPLRTETGARGQGWLVDWLASLLGGKNDDPMTPHQSRALQQAVAETLEASDALKEFDHLPVLLGATDDDGVMQARMGEWASGGRYGWLFAQAPLQGQGIRLDADVTGIDMTEILDTDLERRALLAYLFRRIEVLVEDRRPTIIILDEAWKLLDDSYFVAKLQDWLVTMRKKNVVVLMLTQSPLHLEGSKVGQIIREMTVTQVFFPNAKARSQDYHPFNLTAKELDWLLSADTPRRTAVIRSPGGSAFARLDLKSLGRLVTVLGGGGAGDALAAPNWRSDPNFWRMM